MPSFNAFRVHADALQPGDHVPASTAFFDGLDPKKQAVEKAFDDVKPSEKPSRRATIYLFEQETDAHQWCIRHATRRLYVVEVEPAAVQHRGDWNWLGKALRYATDPAAIQACAESYWRGEPCDVGTPVWELLVSDAIVLREILIPQEEYDAANQEKDAVLDDIAADFQGRLRGSLGI